MHRSQILKLLMHQIADSYRENGMSVPRDFYKGVDPGFNKMIDNLRKSKLNIDTSSAWRKQREHADLGGSTATPTAQPTASALGKRPRSVNYAGMDSDEGEGGASEGGEGGASEDEGGEGGACNEGELREASWGRTQDRGIVLGD